MVVLNRPYKGYASGAIVQLGTSEEAALIAQGLASNSAGPVTPGAVSTNATFGRVGIAAGSASVVITNPAFTTESKFAAFLSNGTADGTALYVTRIVPAAGSVQIFVNANATAAIAIDWTLLGPAGGLINGNS